MPIRSAVIVEAHDIVPHHVAEVFGRCRHKLDIAGELGEHRVVLGAEEMDEIDLPAGLGRDGS